MRTVKTALVHLCIVVVAVSAHGAESIETSLATPVEERIPVPVVERLTLLRPDFNCGDLRLSVKLDRVNVGTGVESVRSTPLSVRLDVTPGPSFLVAGTVVNALASVRGDMRVGAGRGQGQWEIRQFNFLNQAPRSHYEPAAQSLALVLPVALVRDDVRVNTVLLVQGSLVGATVRWERFRFGMSKLVAAAFPRSPGVGEALGLPVMVDEKEPVAGSMSACCQGAWCAQCANACSAGGCSYVCDVCTPNACDNDCAAGGPNCCFQ